jgi:transcription initiation factor TFIIB
MKMNPGGNAGEEPNREQRADSNRSGNDVIRRTLEGHTRPCVDCGVTDWQMDDSRGEIICNTCGLVVEENVIDPGAEWTNRDRSQDRSRVGQPLTYTLADKGLNTTIDVRDLNSGSAGRHGISSQSRRDWRRRRVVDVTSFVQINSFGIILDFPSHCKKKLHDFTADSLVKAS